LNAYHGYEEFNNRFSIDSGIFDAFVNYAKDKGVSPEVQGLKRSAVVLETRLKAYIARNIWGNDGFYAVMADDDNVLKVAMEAISAEEQNVPSNRTTQVLR
jgi:carboxyl-terminal processing protease